MVLWSWFIFTFGNCCCCGGISLRLFKWLNDRIWLSILRLSCWCCWWMLLVALKNTASLFSSLLTLWLLVVGWLSNEDKLFVLPLEFDEVDGPNCPLLVCAFCCVDLCAFGWSLNVFWTAVLKIMIFFLNTVIFVFYSNFNTKILFKIALSRK